MIRVSTLPLAPFCRREWQEWLTAMLRAYFPESAEAEGSPSGDTALTMELILVRDGEIAALNAAHLGCPGPTNILSFPSGAHGGEEGAEPPFCYEQGGRADFAQELGSLFLSVDTLKRECLLYGQDEKQHAIRLLAHGMAHLLGYDHGLDMDAVCAVMAAACPDSLDAGGRV